MHRSEPYVQGATGIVQLAAAMLVLVACSKQRHDFLIPMMVVWALVVVSLVVFACMATFGNFSKTSRLQNGVRNLDTAEQKSLEHEKEIDSRETETEEKMRKEMENEQNERNQKYWGFFRDDTPLETVRCKQIISERATKRLFMLLLLVFPSLLSLSSAGLIGFTQSAAVRGVLMCHDKPASHVTLKLYDDDSGPDLDDLMDEGESDAEGHFSLSGTETELMTIDPKLNIYHDCDDGLVPCQRRITIFLPKKYVSRGEHPDKVYDAGIIQLAGKLSGETRDCLHR
ncbi:hypothetical protein PFISCL1PPCAC_12602, partial [Pristionchus fissidentatus]